MGVLSSPFSIYLRKSCLTKGNKQSTKRNRYSVLTSFFNFTINTSQPDLSNPCSSAVIKKVFKRPQPTQWQILDKEVVDARSIFILT